MNIHEFAAMLEGRGYTHEITHAEERQAKELGFVVVFGYSDDCVELVGAISDEVGCYNGGTIYLEKEGIFEECEEECKYSKAAKEQCKTIEAVWGEGDYSWTFKTDIPHATFEITEDGDPYCEGIVFDIKSLAGNG